ncbi:hypothetical protein JCM31447_10740 [Fluviispira sanaruensis]|uniref:Uncharacterized protein n=1 Tax=Fluviispira sanaruensis TaxID=2493639 RepID=A0A4P2VHX3_FLUSA|nr:hypothetical protein JCM31447_10740 [Fluviispira sanaruensis]
MIYNCFIELTRTAFKLKQLSKNKSISYFLRRFASEPHIRETEVKNYLLQNFILIKMNKLRTKYSN